MFLDLKTTSFLLKILNESSTAGSSSSPSIKSTVGLTGSFSDVNDNLDIPFAPKGVSETEFYKKYIKDTTKQMGGNFDDSVGSGGPSLGTLAALGMLKRGMGYKTQPGSALEFLGPKFTNSSGEFSPRAIATSLMPTGVKTAMAAAALETMGPLGSAISKKLGNVALLGIDPFDYATQVMGVDYVADQLSKLGSRQKQQVTSGAGYIKL